MSKGKMLKEGYELKDGVTLFLRHKAQKQLLETLKEPAEPDESARCA